MITVLILFHTFQFNIEILNLPASINYIGWEVFSGCTGLTTIVIPASITEIGKQAFLDVEILQKLLFDANDMPMFLRI